LNTTNKQNVAGIVARPFFFFKILLGALFGIRLQLLQQLLGQLLLLSPLSELFGLFHLHFQFTEYHS
jgi:hypothetical protein